MPRWMPRPRPWISRTSRRPRSHATVTYSSTTDLMSRGWKACRSRASSIGIGFVIGRGDDRFDAAPDGKVAHDSHASRLTRADKIVENLIGDGLVEDAAISKLNHVVLQ